MSARTLSKPAWWPEGFDPVVMGSLLLGWGMLYAPTYQVLATTVWASDEQGHGPIILAVAAWLVWRRREALAALPSAPALGPALAVLLLSLVMFVLGRSQAVLLFEVGSQIPLLVALLLFYKGRAGVRLCLFPLFFLLFMVPLPATLVAAVTTPLKSAVSAVAAELLHALGYPVGRSGVVLTVGQYQLLVADACAGLNSMFTLEALGLLYLQLVNHPSLARNVFLALVVVPIAFVANVIRVVVLVLVTFHFGDAAGQGFVHDFAGMVLFLAALMLIVAVDGLITAVQRARHRLRSRREEALP